MQPLYTRSGMVQRQRGEQDTLVSKHFGCMKWPAEVSEVGQCYAHLQQNCNQVCMQSELQSSLHAIRVAIKFACTQSQSCNQVCMHSESELQSSVWPALCSSVLCFLGSPLLALPAATLQTTIRIMPALDWQCQLSNDLFACRAAKFAEQPSPC